MQENSQNKSLIKRNISEYLDKSGISQYKFYKESGISRGTLGNSSGLTEDNILKFLDFAKNINKDWLFTGRGEMLRPVTENGADYVIEEQVSQFTEPDTHYKANRIPLYNTRNPKTILELLAHPDSIQATDYLNIPNMENCDGALYVFGESMDPLIKSGDIVAFKAMKDKSNSWFWGEIYLLIIQVEDEQMVLLNYVQKSEKGSEYISLNSFNPTHQQKDIHMDQVIAFALVKASIRINN